MRTKTQALLFGVALFGLALSSLSASAEQQRVFVDENGQAWVQPVIGKTRVTDSRRTMITPWGRQIVRGGSSVRTSYSQPVYGEAIPVQQVAVVQKAPRQPRLR